MTKEKNTLGQRSVKAAGVGLAGTAAKLVLQLGVQLILLRLVSPEDYGLFAISAICISFANFLSNAGLSAALIQRESIDKADIVCAFSWQALLGGVVTGAVFLAAPLIATFFSKPELVESLRVLSFVCFFSAASSVSNSLLVRDLRYLEIHRSNLVSYAVGYGFVGIGLAYFGYGYLSLIAAWLTQAVLLAALYYISAPHQLGFSLRSQGAQPLSAFGSRAIVTNLMNWWNNSIDKIAVGHFYAAADTGMYSVAYNLIFTPMMQLLGTLQSVAFSASSRLVSEDDYRSISMGTLFLSTMIFLPAFVAMSLAAKPIMAILLGQKWLEASAILETLSLSFAFISIQGMITPFLWGKGEVEREMWIQIGISIVAVTVILSIIDLGLRVIAIAALMVSLVRFILVVDGVRRAFSVSPNSILMAIAPGTLTAVVVAMLGYWLQSVTVAATGSAIAQIASIMVAYFLCLGASVWFHREKIMGIIVPLIGNKLSIRISKRLSGYQ